MRVAKAAYNTPYRMTKAFIPPKWIARAVKFLNQLLDGKSQSAQDAQDDRRRGRAIHVVHGDTGNQQGRTLGVPLDQAWSAQMKGIIPGLAMGQFGMGIKRFNLLHKLMAQCFCFDIEEVGMVDETDPYRYSRFWADEYNEHVNNLIVPGWMFAPDESMSQYKPSSNKTGMSNGKKVSDWDDIPTARLGAAQARAAGQRAQDVLRRRERHLPAR